jgi:hypothetical protein
VREGWMKREKGRKRGAERRRSSRRWHRSVNRGGEVSEIRMGISGRSFRSPKSGAHLPPGAV